MLHQLKISNLILIWVSRGNILNNLTKLTLSVCRVFCFVSSKVRNSINYLFNFYDWFSVKSLVYSNELMNNSIVYLILLMCIY